MNEQQVLIASLALDLKRVALGLQRGSVAMANRFKEEALQREAELEQQELSEYLQRLVADSKKVLQSTEPGTHEDALMYSVLFQNYVQKNTDSRLE